jgi:hypothetical protein
VTLLLLRRLSALLPAAKVPVFLSHNVVKTLYYVLGSEHQSLAPLAKATLQQLVEDAR